MTRRATEATPPKTHQPDPEQAQALHATPKTTTSPSKTIEIKLALPELPRRLPHPSTVITLINRIPELNRRTLLVGGIGLIALSAVVTANALLNGRYVSSSNAASTNPLDRLERGTPTYPTVLPAGKTSEQLGGWTRVSPPEREAVYAYTDKIDNIPISVSQQPLPADFRNDVADKVESMAFGFSANEKLTVGRTTLYIGSSTNGPQSVILAKNDLLILMKSAAPIDSKKWGAYATSLR